MKVVERQNEKCLYESGRKTEIKIWITQGETLKV